MGATHIGWNIWQGSAPPEGSFLETCGVNLLVLCAMEYQPPAERFPGVRRVLHVPLDDFMADPQTMRAAEKASRVVMEASRRGEKVIVTCAQGRNRSGLVVALAILRMTGRSARRIVRLIQTKRDGALTNPHFVKALEREYPTSEVRA